MQLAKVGDHEFGTAMLKDLGLLILILVSVRSSR
jgi:hypothetical protein